MRREEVARKGEEGEELVWNCEEGEVARKGEEGEEVA